MSQIVVKDFGGSVLIPQSAVEIRDAALESAALVTRVASAAGQNMAVTALRDLKRIAATIESDREIVKAPVLKLGRDIDAKAREFLAAVNVEIERIGGMINAFQKAEQDRSDAAEALRQEEIKRQEKERQEAARKAAAEGNRQAVVAAMAPVSIAPVAPPARSAGMAISQPWKFEVVDTAAAYAKSPHLFDVIPKTFQINAAIRSGLREHPGLRIWQEVKAGVRL